MATITNEITLDVAEDNVLNPVKAKQFDSNSRFLKVQLTNLKAPIQIPSGSQVQINARRADDEKNAFTGSVNSDGTVTVPITAWMLQLDGQVYCDVSIRGTDQLLTTLQFALEVERSNNGSSPILPSDGPTYEELISQVDAYQQTAAQLNTQMTTVLADLNSLKAWKTSVEGGTTDVMTEEEWI